MRIKEKEKEEATKGKSWQEVAKKVGETIVWLICAVLIVILHIIVLFALAGYGYAGYLCMGVLYEWVYGQEWRAARFERRMDGCVRTWMG